MNLEEFERNPMVSNNVNILIATTDWGFVSSLVEIISSVTTCVAMVLASLVAIYGIKSWRHEFKGKRQIELAEDVLALFYQAKDAIASIRNPLATGAELSAPPKENEPIEEKEARDKVHFIFKRYKDREELFSKLCSVRYRFMAQIGADKVGPFDEIIKTVNEIVVSGKMLAYLWAKHLKSFSETRKEEYYKQIQKYEAKIWWGLPEEDEIAKRVDKAVTDMDEICKAIIFGTTTQADKALSKLGRRSGGNG